MRLTERKDSGHWSLRDVPWNQFKPGVVITKKIWEKLYRALWKLKDYEDTGVDPDEIGDAINYRVGWIPATERLPETGKHVLISFSNFTVPITGRYEEDEEGGAFFAGDEDESLISKGLIVNAWMPLPEPYNEDE